MPAKLVLDCDNELWSKVAAFKVRTSLKSNNEAVITLIKLGLETTTPKTEEPHGV